MEGKNHYTNQSIFDKYKREIGFGIFITFLVGATALGIKRVGKTHAEYYSALNPKTTQSATAEENELERFLRNMTPKEQRRLEESLLENFRLLYKKGNSIQSPNLETSVDEILANHKPWEKEAYKKILSHKAELEQIASQYENINPALLMAVLKSESTGLEYKRSKAGGTGQMQLLFKGAYSFFWNIFNNNDPYYKKIRKRYAHQLDKIFSAWIKNKIYIAGNKGETWRRLKHYFKNNHFYQNVNMGALYLDFLIYKFKNEKLGLAAYNAGETEVRKAEGIPNFGETKRYVEGVLRDIKSFKKLFRAYS